jgi:sucrose-6-phosphate hydrolase SacC (GH32 family)
MRLFNLTLLSATLGLAGCSSHSSQETGADSTRFVFPEALISFTPYENNPVFAGTGQDTWDERIRERGFIIKEDDGYHMWYTGYQKADPDKMKYLGYATSDDGLNWKRYHDKPLYTAHWIEDMYVLKEDGVYYMFAESKDDIPRLFTSTDRINWTDKGILDVRKVNGEPIDAGPYGTPTVWKENGIWNLYYERNDKGIWLARSEDLKIWTNVQDEEVLKCGPESYDKYAVAFNEIIKENSMYYAYYHASAFEDWREWTMNIAVSEDLINWKKYDGNPIMRDNRSSGMPVRADGKIRFYTAHPEVMVYLPKE